MPTDTVSTTREQKWHIDHINKAPNATAALVLAVAWLVAELKACQFRRPADADGFRWQIIHVIHSFALEISRSRPAPEFQAGRVPLPGGGWTPKPGTTVQHP